MKFAKPLVLPGAGFRTWLVHVAVVATLAGFAWSVSVMDSPFWVVLLLLNFVGLPVGGFALFSLLPISASFWVSVRYVRRVQCRTAAAYGLVPVVAFAIAVMSGSIAYRVTQWSTTQLRLWHLNHAIAAAREAGKMVTTADDWIDPGPPTRAKFAMPSPFMIGIYVIYAERSDIAWLNDQAKGCQAEGRIVTLGKNFYRIAGEC